MGRRRTRRVKYYPAEVVQKILNSDVLLALASILLNESTPLPCGEITRKLSRTTTHRHAVARPR